MMNVTRGVRNASWLSAGKLAARVINFAGFIYIVRKLSPEDYGIYVTVGAFVRMFAILTLSGINKAVLREGSKDPSSMALLLEDVAGLKNLLVALAITACVACSFFAPYDLRTRLYIVLFSAVLAHTGFRGFLDTVYQAHQQMHYMAIFAMINRSLFVFLSITLLHFGFGLTALFIVSLFANFLTLVINYRYARGFAPFKLLAKIRFRPDLLKAGLVFSLANTISLMATRIDLVMISLMGTVTEVGIYGIAQMFAREAQWFKRSVSTAFFPILVKHFHERAMDGKKLIRCSVLFLCGTLVAAWILSLVVPYVVPVVFGEDYIQSGRILSVLIFYLAFVFAYLPFSLSMQATHNERLSLYINSINAAMNITLNILFYRKFGLIGIAYSTLVVYGVGNLLGSALIYVVLRKNGRLT